MPNSEQVNSIVAPEARAELVELKQLLTDAISLVSDLNAKGKTFEFKISGANTVGELTATIKQLQDNTTALTAAQMKQLEASKLIAETQAQEAIARKNNAEGLKAETAATILLTKEQERQAKNAAVNKGAYYALNEEYKKAAINVKNLSIELGAENEQTIAASASLKVMYEQLKLADAAAGQFNRNVGNYPGAKGFFSGIATSAKEAGTAVVNSFKAIPELLISLLAFESAVKIFDVFKEELFESNKNVKLLEQSLENAGKAQLFAEYSAQAEELANKLKYLKSQDVLEVFTKLVDYGKLTKQQISDLVPVITDLAAKKNISLAESTELITKALEGNNRGLKDFGINMDAAKKTTETAASTSERFAVIMTQLKPRIDGVATAFGDTFAGKLQSAIVSFKEYIKSIGEAVVQLSGYEEKQLQKIANDAKDAQQGQVLLDRYKELSAQTVKTTADKRELDVIETKLVQTFGDSVIEVDKETGAIRVNISETETLIKQKLLLADTEAARAAANIHQAEQERTQAIAREEEQQRLLKLSHPEFRVGDPFDPDVAKFTDEIKKQKDIVKESTDKITDNIAALKKLGHTYEEVQALFKPVGADEIVGSGDADPGKTKPGKDFSKEQISAQERVNKANAELRKVDLQNDMNIQKSIFDNEKALLSDRLAANSKYLNDKLAISKIDEQVELQNIQLNLNKIAEIESKPKSKRTDEEKSLIIQKAAFEAEKTAIIAKFQIKNNDILEEGGKFSLDIINKTDKKILDNLDDFAQKQREHYLQAAKKELDIRQSVANEKAKLEKQTAETLIGIGDLIIDHDLKNLDKQRQAIEDKKASDVDAANATILSEEMKQEAISRGVDASVVLNETKAKLIIQADQKALAAEQANDKKKEQLAKTRFILDKSASAAEVAVAAIKDAAKAQTAVGVLTVEALSNPALLPLIPLAESQIPLILGTAAASEALILAQIFAYAKGTQDHPGGKFVAGDGGERELILTPDGRAYMSADKPTIYNEPAHTQVFNQDQINNMLYGLSPKLIAGLSENKKAGNIEEALDKNAKEIVKAIRNNPATAKVMIINNHDELYHKLVRR